MFSTVYNYSDSTAEKRSANRGALPISALTLINPASHVQLREYLRESSVHPAAIVTLLTKV